MELKEYLRLLRRRWLLISGATLVVVAVVGVLTFRATPQYASDARVVISASAAKNSDAPDSAYLGGQAATQRVQTYASLVSDGDLTRRVVSVLGLDMTPAELAKKLHAEVVQDTTVLSLRVTDPSPRLAERICREVTKQLLSIIDDIETPPGQTSPLLKGTVVSAASTPLDPVSPKPVRNLGIGLVLGLLLGLGLALARELLDSSVKTADEIEESLDAPVLGGIAFDAGTARTPLVTGLSSHAPRVEAFRVLRTNLQFVDVDAGRKIFVVTSSVPGEGKSTTAVNVALTMASAGQRVLLVDADLRRPQVARMLGLESEVGVTSVLLGRVSLDDAVQEHHDSGLHVLASGAIPPNPAELLQSRAMGDLVVTLREEYDAVVIDSPPLLPVTDAALIAAQTDGAVVVVRHGKTTHDQLRAASERLRGVEARVLGAVFNRVKATRGGGYESGYGYGYGYAPDASAEVIGAEADLRPDLDRPRAARTRVAEVLPIKGSRDKDAERAGRTSRRAAGPAVGLQSSDLAGTGTSDVPAPGRHRS